MGLRRYLVPEEKVNLEGMCLCLSARALALCRRATAPRGGVPAPGVPGCGGEWVAQGESLVCRWEEVVVTWSSSSARGWW